MTQSTTECSHRTSGSCVKCASPFYGDSAWKAQYFGPGFAKRDVWQAHLLYLYAYMAGIGAAESPLLEV